MLNTSNTLERSENSPMHTSQPLVSIIVPCYNQARYLPDALASVASQTYPHWECIIVNDGSLDHTSEVARQWLEKDDRFKYVEKQNGGLSSARNAGLKLAKGEYIQLLDADDLLEADKIKVQITRSVEDRGGVDVWVSGYRYFQDTDESRQLLIFGPLDILPEVAMDRGDKKDVVKLFARRNPMVVSAPLYHKSVFHKIGQFDEELGANEDWDFHFRCAVGGIVFQHCGYAPHSKTLIRIHAGSMVANRRNMIKNLMKLQQKHRHNAEFALANGLVVKDFRQAAYRFLKMLVPPVFIWLLKKILWWL